MASEEHIPAYVQEHGPLEIPLRLVRFDECIAALRLDPGWQRGERVAHTLVKEGLRRAVLTLLPAGAQLQEHQAGGAATIQCLQGRLRVQTAVAPPMDLGAGELVALDAGVRHSAEAITECAFLVTLAQTGQS
jgi:quercetin dioxygenase-like cupin family protein